MGFFQMGLISEPSKMIDIPNYNIDREREIDLRFP